MTRPLVVFAAAVGGLLALLGALMAVPLLAWPTTAPHGTKPSDVETIPPRVLAAYKAVDGWCPGLRWQLVAGIGAIESGHGTTNHAATDPSTGRVEPPIFGPPLDGSHGTQHLAIGQWVGWFGLQGPWQQAVGPMQFLPATFEEWAVDDDGDGIADPHDIDDAVATTANFLCQGHQGVIADERTAVLRYNHDDAYVARVTSYAKALAREG